ncbi:MAG: hypothetical protein WBL23_02640 [Salinisphaera sp.]|uniref:hypothetical protein n=1 Tax=Salinisphaera sp. TaxID=1914330 RepID=UPI003C7A0EE4
MADTTDARTLEQRTIQKVARLLMPFTAWAGFVNPRDRFATSFAATPNFRTLPTQDLSGSATAVGLTIVNTLDNIGSFSSGYVSGRLRCTAARGGLPYAGTSAPDVLRAPARGQNNACRAHCLRACQLIIRNELPWISD